MSKRTCTRTPASTYLVHHFGRGALDEGYNFAVERFRATSDGNLRRWPLDAPSGNGRSRPKPEVATFKRIRDLRPAYNEVIVCTALGTRAGVQYWGYYAAWGLFPDRRQRR